MALTRITKGVIKPNENYDTHNINSTGIVTAIGLDVNGNGDISGNLSVGGVLTYEDVTSIDSVGIITAQSDIHVGGGVSAVGVGTFSGLDISGDIDVDGHTNLDNVSIAGITTGGGFKTAGTSSDAGATNGFTAGRINIYDNNSHNIFRIGSNPSFAPTVWQTSNIVFSTNGFYVRNTASTRNYIDINNTTGILKLGYGAGTNYGYKLETSAKGIKVGTGVTIETNGQATFSGITTFSGNIDVDGQTTLDNVSIAGVATVTSALADVATFTSNQTASTIYVKDTDGDGIFISGSSTYGHRIYTNTTEDLLLGTNSTEKLRIDSNGHIKLSGRNVQGSANGDKLLRIYQPSRTDAEEDVLLLQSYNQSGTNSIIIGGGDSSFNAATDISFRTASVNTTSGTERLRIDGNGKLGVGDFSSTSVAQQLHVRGSQPEIYLEHTGGYDMTLTTNDGAGQNGITVNGGALSLAYNNKDVWMCRTGGRVFIGTPNPINTSTSKFQVAANDATGSAILARFSASSYSSYLDFYKSRNATLGSETVVNSGDNLGAIRFYGCDGNGYYTAAEIYGTCDGGASDNDMPGRLTFHTRPDGNSSNMTERLRIASGGDIITQGLTSRSFNNDGNNAKVLEVTGDGTVGEYGVLNLSGNQNSSATVGAIKFINRENSNSSSGSSANSKSLATIDVFADTSDSNAGDDCGGFMRFVTKADGGGNAERLRITSGGQIFVGGNTGWNESTALISMATDSSAGANMLSDTSAIYNHNNPAFIHVQNRYNTGTGQEAGIIFHSKSSYNGSWAIYGKRTSSNYLSDLIFRNRTGSGASAERLRITSGGQLQHKSGSGVSYFNGASEYIFGSTVSSPSSGGSEANVQIHAHKTRAQFSINAYMNNSGGPFMQMVSSRSGTVGTLGTVTLNNDTLGDIRFGADDGNGGVVYGAQIISRAKTQATTNGIAARIEFATAKDASSSTRQVFSMNEGGALTGESDTAALYGYHISLNNTNHFLDLTQWTRDSFVILELFGGVNPNSSGSGAYNDPVHMYIYKGTGWTGSRLGHYIYCVSVAPPARHVFPSGSSYSGNAQISAVWTDGTSTYGNETATSTHYIRLLIPNGNSSNNFTKSVRIFRRR